VQRALLEQWKRDLEANPATAPRTPKEYRREWRRRALRVAMARADDV